MNGGAKDSIVVPAADAVARIRAGVELDRRGVRLQSVPMVQVLDQWHLPQRIGRRRRQTRGPSGLPQREQYLQRWA